VFTSVPDLKRKLLRYIRQYSKQPKPVKWKYFDTKRRSTRSPIREHTLGKLVTDVASGRILRALVGDDRGVDQAGGGGANEQIKSARRLGRLDEAQSYFDAVLTHEPWRLSTQIELAFTLTDSGRHREARPPPATYEATSWAAIAAVLGKASAIDPQGNDARISLAGAQEKASIAIFDDRIPRLPRSTVAAAIL
jgi:hypothetical protein